MRVESAMSNWRVVASRMRTHGATACLKCARVLLVGAASLGTLAGCSKGLADSQRPTAPSVSVTASLPLSRTSEPSPRSPDTMTTRSTFVSSLKCRPVRGQESAQADGIFAGPFSILAIASWVSTGRNGYKLWIGTKDAGREAAVVTVVRDGEVTQAQRRVQPVANPPYGQFFPGVVSLTADVNEIVVEVGKRAACFRLDLSSEAV